MLNVDEFCHLCCGEFFLYMYTFMDFEKVLEDFSWGSRKVLEKSWFFVSKRVGTLYFQVKRCWQPWRCSLERRRVND